MGISDDDLRAHGIVWILFEFDIIWVFVLYAASSSEVPVVLQNQPSVLVWVVMCVEYI